MNTKTNHERGQSLVLVAVLMVALVGMLALALDMGYVYTMRRAAQNAADAGALAGARALCLNLTEDINLRSTIAQTAAKRFAGDFSITGSFNRAPAGTNQIAGAAINDAIREVTVTVTIDYNTLLGGAFGRPANTIQAIAAARCSPTDTAEGALPVAKYCPDETEVIGGVTYYTCGIDFGEMDDTCDVGIDKFIVFMNESNSGPSDDVGDIEDETSLYWCPSWGTKPTGSITVNCEISGSPLVGDDIEPVMTSNPSHSWIWVDLSPDGTCSNSNCMVDEVNGSETFTVSTHTWVNGGSGGHTVVYKAIEDYRIDPGDYVIVPLFDDRCMGDPSVPSTDCAGRIHGNDQFYVGTGVNANDVFFHLNTFAIFKVTCVDDGGKGTCIGRNNLFDQSQGSEIKDPPKVKSFEGCFVGGFVPQLSGQSDEPYYTGGFSVYLNR